MLEFLTVLKRSFARISFTSTFFEESFVHVLIGTLAGLCAEFDNLRVTSDKCGSPCHGRCRKTGSQDLEMWNTKLVTQMR